MIRRLHLFPWFALLIPVIYVLTGTLGVTGFSRPPGYATTIFLPSGIAVGSIFLFRAKALPSVFLGAMGLNVVIDLLHSNRISLLGTEAALAIAVASSLQALCGGYLFRHFMTFYDYTLINYKNLLRLTALVPFVSLISATLSNICLWLLGILSLADAPGSWIGWYMGDMFGMLVALPWMLLFFPLDDQVKKWTTDIIKGKLR